MELILERLAAGESPDQLPFEHPRLTLAAIRADISFAAQAVRADVIYPAEKIAGWIDAQKKPSVLLESTVRVIGKRGLFERSARFTDAKAALFNWYAVAVQSRWSSLEDIRRAFPATDMIGPLAVFNIKGNNYRLIVRIQFRTQRIYVKEFLTHAEYDRQGWMKWL